MRKSNPLNDISVMTKESATEYKSITKVVKVVFNVLGFILAFVAMICILKNMYAIALVPGVFSLIFAALVAMADELIEELDERLDEL